MDIAPLSTLKITPSPLAPAGDASAAHNFEAGRDRIMLTLLALNLMLLAFFVVMNSTTSFDKNRTRAAVESLQSAFVSETVAEEAAPVNDARVAAVGTLQTVVADVFAPLLPPRQSWVESPNRDRVDVDVPVTAFFEGEGAVRDTLPILDRIVGIVTSPPPGFRTELAIGVLSGDSSIVMTDSLATLAHALAQRGLPPMLLSVGAWEKSPVIATPKLRFTFLLTDADDLAPVRLVGGLKKRAP